MTVSNMSYLNMIYCIWVMIMKQFYFRKKEKEQIKQFIASENKKALAIYGRRRTGKTELILNAINDLEDRAYYFQISSFDYETSLQDFKNILKRGNEDSILDSLNSFKDVFVYINKEKKVIVIDEFPFLAKKNANISVEFQYIIDHCLNGNIKLVLLGSNRSFMKGQIEDSSSPLYGRFDEIISLMPFSFNEVKQLFNREDDAINVYTMTGGVAQYVMFFKEYDDIDVAMNQLYFNRNGRLYLESGNYLNQEFKDATTYNLILRYLGSSDKKASDIASFAKVDNRAIYSYLNKLEELNIIEMVKNPLSNKKDKRYHISDLYLRFAYTFIEPNISLIISLEEKAKPFILNEQYNEYLGFIYEEIIRNSLYQFALTNKLDFMPIEIGKWWGNIYINGKWCESEIDVVGVNKTNVILGECKYRNKKIGLKELEQLKYKSSFILKENQKAIYLLASASGFTDELLQLKENDVLLIEGVEIKK